MSAVPAHLRTPSRDEIAARVTGQLPGTQASAPPPDGDVVAWFGCHARAGLAACGWMVRDLAERAGDPAGNVGQALNGTKCPMALAGRIAAALGLTLAEMVVPYSCRTCAGYGGKPPKGTACLECAAETRAT